MTNSKNHLRRTVEEFESRAERYENQNPNNRGEGLSFKISRWLYREFRDKEHRLEVNQYLSNRTAILLAALTFTSLILDAADIWTLTLGGLSAVSGLLSWHYREQLKELRTG